MKSEKIRNEKKKRSVRSVRLTPTAYAWVWVLLVVLAAVFSQALRNPVSYSFAVTVLFIPPLELLYLALTVPFIKTVFVTEGKTVVKLSPFHLELRVRNRSFLPAPFISLSYTAEGGESSVARVPLPPFGTETLSAEVRFGLRGLRPCRLDYTSADSLLRMFRVTVRSDGTGSVLVLPRVLDIDMPEPREVVRLDIPGMNLSENDSDEVEEITEYRPGDKLKNVHWKLSGKADTLLVKKYGSRNSSESLIIPDLRVMGREGSESDRIADRVTELAVAAALNRSERDRAVTVRLPETPDGDFTDYGVGDRDDLDACLPAVAAAPCLASDDPYALFGRRPEGETVFITPNCDPGTVSFVNELSVACPPVTVIYCPGQGAVADGWRGAAEVDIKTFSWEELS
ncbi:MAG: DUF58 domain-containing protein [Clostridia bacterium]|nr:DUF58 domain-containing protein [Clostridia bacterium]